MQVISFVAPHIAEFPDEFLAIRCHDNDSKLRIPVYKKEVDNVYRRTPVFSPSCTKFLHYIEFKFDKEMSLEEIEKEFGEIEGLCL